LDNLSKQIIDVISHGKENVKFYFHACSASSTHNILTYGINLDLAKKCGNFSHGKGFYVSDCLEKVLIFAAEKFRSNDRISVVVFEFEEDPKLHCPGLDLSCPEEEERLRKVVSYFKNGAVPQRPNLDQHGLEFDFKRRYQFINGPYCDFTGQGAASAPENVQIYRELSRVSIS
jgi:hypothetical protein